MWMFLFFLPILYRPVSAQYESPDPSSPAPSSNYCGAFVECAAVSLLEERLCLGNSLWRPYWLPERKDPFDCHQKLKNDYTTLERLEEELDGQLVACLNENSKPIDKKTNEQCQLISRPPRFSFSRTITYVPTHCFTGVKRRIERQCGQLMKCCPSIEKCKLLSSESTLQKMINTTKTNLKKRADDCKKGMVISPIILDGVLFSEDDDSREKTWAPTGNVNVRFTDEETNRRRQNQDGRGNGFVNVRFTTQQENEERARKLIIRYGDKEGDGLTLPKLSYPPQSKKDFEKKFDAAMRKTDSIKQRIETLDRSKIAKEGFDSLIDAATVSETINNMPPMGTVTLLDSNDDNVVVEDSGDKSSVATSVVVGSSSESVTTNPIIFVEKIAVPQKNRTIEKCRVSTTIRFSNILKMLGENPNSKDFKEVKGLVDKFEKELRGKKLSEEQQNKAKLIEKTLEMLLENFDDTEYEKVEKDVEKVVNETKDLPICEEEESTNSTILTSESIDDARSTMLVDDNGDKFIIQKGSTTLIIGGEEEKGKEEHKNGDEVIRNFISEEYKVEIEAFRREHNLWTKQNSNTTLIKRNETTCDMYMRCRSQMHLAVDSCAWRFASDQLLATMAESAESLLFKDDGVCSQKDGDKFVELYESMIKRNDKLRVCLDDKNEQFFEESVCLAYPEERRHQYDDSLRRLLNTSFEYSKSRECFHDANMIQEKCTHLRDCCPNFDECREETFEVEIERTIINLTATINELKQECVKRKAKEAVKNVVRQLLLNTDAGQKLEAIAQLGLDISRGARVVRMAKYRA
uniref:ShKT domain-containing protein n=1 Tax=Caenorhabditis tropicalis TaxID=1561998 RepID=A0A1I7TV93_9PELO